MRACVLLLRRQLGAGAAPIRQIEQRIVTEAPAAARGCGDDPLVRAARLCQERAGGIRHADHTNETSLALALGHTAELSQELLVVGAITLLPGAAGAGVTRG